LGRLDAEFFAQHLADLLKRGLVLLARLFRAKQKNFASIQPKQ